MSAEVTRLDKWLFCARFARTRSLSAAWVEKGKIRLNGQAVSKAGQRVRIGDVLTFAKGEQVFVIEVLALAERRVSAPDAAMLYARRDAPQAGR